MRNWKRPLDNPTFTERAAPVLAHRLRADGATGRCPGSAKRSDQEQPLKRTL